MAKQKKTVVNKTQAIKEAMAKFPKLGPAELAKKLNAQGVSVSPAYVSTIKSSLRRKARKATPAQRKTASRARNGAANGYVAISALQQAQAFIEKAGGVDQAREVLDVVAKLK